MHEEQRFEGIVLTVRDSGKAGKSVQILTREDGLFSFFAPQSRRSSAIGGYLLPGTHLQLTLRQDNDIWLMIQAEGQALANVMEWTYEDWLPFYFWVHWLEQLFPYHERDDGLYLLTERYVRWLDRKNKTVLTIFACWQMTVLAGYDPRGALDTEHFLPLSTKSKKLLAEILDYHWENEERVFSRSALIELGNALIYYGNEYMGLEMRTTDLFEANL